MRRREKSEREGGKGSVREPMAVPRMCFAEFKHCKENQTTKAASRTRTCKNSHTMIDREYRLLATRIERVGTIKSPERETLTMLKIHQSSLIQPSRPSESQSENAHTKTPQKKSEKSLVPWLRFEIHPQPLMEDFVHLKRRGKERNGERERRIS